MTNLVAIAWVATGSFIGSFGAVFLKIGATHLSRNLRSLLTNWRLALGVFLYLLSSVFYIIGVSKGDLSALYPMVSLGSVFTLLWSKIILGESITRTKVAAVGIILVGCFVLGVGSRAPAAHPAASAIHRFDTAPEQPAARMGHAQRDSSSGFAQVVR